MDALPPQLRQRSLDATIAASERLDRLLEAAIKGTAMPDVGGKRLAGSLSEMLAGVRKAMDETKLDIAAAVTELTTEVRGGKDVARALRAEANDVRKAFAEVLGNGGGEDAEPDPTTAGPAPAPAPANPGDA